MAVASPLFRALPLAQFGLTWVDPPAALAHPLDNGDVAMLETSIDATAARYAFKVRRYLKSGAVLRLTAGQLTLLRDASDKVVSNMILAIVFAEPGKPGWLQFGRSRARKSQSTRKSDPIRKSEPEMRIATRRRVTGGPCSGRRPPGRACRGGARSRRPRRGVP